MEDCPTSAPKRPFLTLLVPTLRSFWNGFAHWLCNEISSSERMILPRFDGSPSSPGQAHAERAKTRCRSRSNPLRPYACRLINFKRFTCPSTCRFPPLVRQSGQNGSLVALDACGKGLQLRDTTPRRFFQPGLKCGCVSVTDHLHEGLSQYTGHFHADRWACPTRSSRCWSSAERSSGFRRTKKAGTTARKACTLVSLALAFRPEDTIFAVASGVRFPNASPSGNCVQWFPSQDIAFPRMAW
jgi:hypothetical protein